MTNAFGSEHCSSHHDATSMQSIENLCIQRGIRFTPIRKQILQLIWDSHCAKKAYDLLEEIKPFFKNAKPVTVYRTLDFLQEQGFIHKIESLNAFIACNQGHCDYERMFLICTQCHEIEEQTGKDMAKTINEELQHTGFIHHYKTIEIQGLCVNCAAKGK